MTVPLTILGFENDNNSFEKYWLSICSSAWVLVDSFFFFFSQLDLGQWFGEEEPWHTGVCITNTIEHCWNQTSPQGSYIFLHLVPGTKPILGWVSSSTSLMKHTQFYKAQLHKQCLLGNRFQLQTWLPHKLSQGSGVPHSACERDISSQYLHSKLL